MLDDDFVTLVQRAEKEQNMLLVTKANAMKRKTEDIDSELQSIEKACEILAKKKKDLH